MTTQLLSPTRRRRAATAAAIVAVVAITSVALPSCDQEAVPTNQKVTLGSKEYNLELALTEAQISRGLMFRESLADDGGMLFVFRGEALRQFWMKNCLIDLDALFMDRTGLIVHKVRMYAPDPNIPEQDLPRYSSKYPAQFVIELAAGTADKLGLKPGDRVSLPIERLKELVR
jgi:uncharacterized membrane protein (UPF0127 family)